jgi:hypothetical protein
MATAEVEKAKAAIAGSDLTQVLELAIAIKARLKTLGVSFEEFGQVAFGPAPMPGEAETWAGIEQELAAHDAGEKGFTLAEMRSFARP